MFSVGLAAITFYLHLETQDVFTTTDEIIETQATNLIVLSDIAKQIHELETIHHVEELQKAVETHDHANETELKDAKSKIEELQKTVRETLDETRLSDEFKDVLIKKTDDFSEYSLHLLDMHLHSSQYQESDIDDAIEHVGHLEHEIHDLLDEQVEKEKEVFESLHHLAHEKQEYGKSLLTVIFGLVIGMIAVTGYWIYRTTALKEENTLKTEFSSMITHELKTPLVPIITGCEILEEEISSKLDNFQKEEVTTIKRNAKNLLKLISDILDVQKLDLKKIVISKSKFSVGKLFEELVDDFNLMTANKKITVSVEQEDKKLEINSDRARIYQVFSNLIKNSIDFVDPNTGTVIIGCKNTNSSKDGHLIFFVKDNGTGIPPGIQSKLFKKFYQVDTSVTRRHGGTGLGLTICKGIVDALGGKIWYESELGKGTTMYFSVNTS